MVFVIKLSCWSKCPGYEFISLPLPCISFAILTKLHCWISSIDFMGVCVCVCVLARARAHTLTHSTHTWFRLCAIFLSSSRKILG